MRPIDARRSVTAVLLTAGFAVAAAAPAAADDCPNAGLRPGPAATLPDCRAYEQVSPVDKSGNDVVSTSTVASVAGGDRVYFNASGSISGSETVIYDTAYLGARGGDWTTRGIDPPITQGSLIVKTTLGLSEDGTQAVVVSTKALAPGATEGGTNLYLRDLTEPASYRLVVTTPTQAFYNELNGFGGQGGYIGGTDDLSTFVFSTATSLLPGVPDGTRVLYAWRDGRLSLASQAPDGTPLEVGFLANTPSRTRGYVSADGSRITFTTTGATTPIYQEVDGQGSTLISRSHRAGDDPAAPIAVAAPIVSADGGSVVFGSGTPLTAGAAVNSLYRWSAADDSLVDLAASFTVPAGSGRGVDATLTAVSPDGRYVWFTSGLPLTADAGAGNVARLYVTDTTDGTVRYVASFSEELGGPGNVRLSPDGRRIAFQSYSPVTGVPNANPACNEPGSGLSGLCAQIFTFDAAAPADPVVCVSCGPAGTVDTGPVATFGRPSTFFDGRDSRVILDDGRVFFDSANRLVPGDTNTVSDVYEYTPGTGLALLSSGTSGDAASFGDISENGRDVFFTTADRLVAQDTDALADLYTARVGGGIPAQRVAPVAAGGGCSGDACRPATATQPGRPVQGSVTLQEPKPGVVPRATVAKPSAKARRSAARTGRLKLRVRLNRAGTVSASLRGRLGARTLRTAASTTRTVGKPGTVTLTLKLSRRARAALRRTGRLSLRLTVAYSERLTRYRTTVSLTAGRTGSKTKGGAR